MRHFVTGLMLWLLAGNALAGVCTPDERVSQKSVFWGDLHVHTAFSMDAYVFNNTATPEDAYAFAKGAPQVTPGGQTVALSRPLDFAAVTDHGEYFGLMNLCRDQGDALEYCGTLAEAAAENSRRGFNDFFLPALLAGDKNCQVDEEACRAYEVDLWQKTIDAADAANEPCRFTAFVASEWSKSPDNHHWHRNLIYATSTVPERAINALDQPTQEALWSALQLQCEQVEGCDVLAIPHNSNLGQGGAFRLSEDGANLALRARFERLLEIHQNKGNSECYTGSLFSDEACAFEEMLPIPLLRELADEPRSLSPDEHRAVASGYARDVLARGLAVHSEQGVNPFAYGFIGSTDTHAARPGDVDEAGWVGHIGGYDEVEENRSPAYNPGGLVAVWAEENTRASIFEALRRKETYATSGPRIRLRFDHTFGAYASCERTVGEVLPMGSTVRGSTARPPAFIVRAMKDVLPLQRVDIIKLFLRDGRLQQAVYTFAADAGGKADWCVTWRDDDYRADEFALWYTRVLEVPSLRWDGETRIRERAWSSPIWSVP